MDRNIKGNSFKRSGLDMVFTLIQAAVDMRVNSKMVIDKVMEHISFKVAEDLKENSPKVNSMVITLIMMNLLLRDLFFFKTKRIMVSI